MKFVFAIFALLLISMSAFPQAGGVYDATGAVKTQYKQFATFVNSASGALTRGQGICLDTGTDDGIGIDFCATEGAKPVGVITDLSCAVGARCKVQTKGFFEFGKFDFAATATTAGGMIYADVDGDLTRPASVTTAMFPLGTTFDAVSADTTALEIYIDL